MNQATIPTVSTLQWSDRTSALRKELAYAFSLDVDFSLGASTNPGGRHSYRAALCNRGQPAERRQSRSYHVRDEVLVTTADGVVRDVPHGSVVRADDMLSVDGHGVGSLDGRILLELGHDVRATISMEYGGVVNVLGGADRLLRASPKPIRGSAFICLRTECELSRYRWMVESQLFGFGRVRAYLVEATGEARAEFSYDLYSAG